MEFKCSLCEVIVHTQSHLDDHLAGKPHQLKAEHKSQMDDLAQRSIYLNNFTHQIDEAELERAMDQFGEVERVVPDRSGKNAFAIVEFKERDAVQNLLHSLQRLRIGKNNVRIHPRRVDFESGISSFSALEQTEELKSADVLKCLDEAGASDWPKQLDALIAKFSIAQNTMSERTEFGQILSQFIQAYFSSSLHIHVFGSSSTGLGFINSDLDLNLVFDDELKMDEVNFVPVSSPSTTTSDEDMEKADDHINPEWLKQNPIDRAAFVRLSKMDRVRLLNRLINEFRKEKGLITAHVPVPDARCPVVRFLLRYPSCVPCELSVRNLLGECKANLVRDLVRAETTGTLWRLLFLLKLWASVNGLFSSNLPPEKKAKKGAKMDETQLQQKNLHQESSKSHWNSYTFSLLVIAFLQQKGRTPAIQLLLRHNSRTIEGWPIEYDLSFFALKDDLPTLLKDFFTFLYQQIKENCVIIPHEGRVLDRSEFARRYIDEDKRIERRWRFSLVNVQDPLELSHNVAANVGHQHLSLLRWKVMYSIAVLKRSSTDWRGLFSLDNSKQLQAERRAEKSNRLEERPERHQQKGSRRARREKTRKENGNGRDGEGAETVMEVDEGT